MQIAYRQLIDTTLLTVAHETSLLYVSLRVENTTFKTDSLNDLRQSKLGQNLIILAEYLTGSPADNQYIQQVLDDVLRTLFRRVYTPLFIVPWEFHRTDLGQFLDASFAKTLEPEILLTATQAGRLIKKSRGHIYDLAMRGQIRPLYLHGHYLFMSDQVKLLAQNTIKEKPNLWNTLFE